VNQTAAFTGPEFHAKHEEVMEAVGGAMVHLLEAYLELANAVRAERDLYRGILCKEAPEFEPSIQLQKVAA
jgi:hypothetical protein